MNSVESPMEIAAILVAFGWPVAAGLGLVVWTKVRAGARQRQQAALDAELKGMFRNVEGKPTPDRLNLVIDALEEAEAMKAAVDAPSIAPKSPLIAG